ncbi:MAG: Tetratricopeptide repeat protein [Myxococcales bacterium]|nr:Tetratricopeptide repeat protein [Myxococcales bacterium]
MKALVLVLALVLLSIPAGPARAEIESALVKKGIAAYTELDYGKAITLLEQARNESLTREEKIITYRTLGMAYVAMGQLGPAKIDFQRLLRVEPTATLDRSVAPKVRAVFEEAKSEAATSVHGVAPALATVNPTVSPTAPREGRPVVVRASYPGGVAKKMVVYFRKAGDASYSRATVEGAPDGSFEATVPGLAVQPPELDYHVVLLDDGGASIAAAGSLGAPISVAVTRQPKPVYAKGWFWGVIGGVAAAGAIATGLALGLPRSSSAPVTVNPQ